MKDDKQKPQDLLIRVVNCDKKTEVKGNFQDFGQSNYKAVDASYRYGRGADFGGVTRSFILCDLG